MLCVVIYENDECPHMWRGPKRCQRGSSERARTWRGVIHAHANPTAARPVGSWPLISSVVTLITRRIIALAHFDIDQEKWKRFWWGTKLKPHAARTRYTVRVPTGPRRLIHDSARLSQSITSSRQTGAISGEESWEPSTNHRDEVSHR